jgi:hypothetical protein
MRNRAFFRLPNSAWRMLYCAREGERAGPTQARLEPRPPLANFAARTASSIRCLVAFLLETSTKNVLLHDCFHTIILVTYE